VGVYKKVAENAVQITELPIGTWTNRYLEHLETLTASGVREKSAAATKKSGKKKKEEQWYIKDIRDNSSDVVVDITVVFKSNLILSSLLKNPAKFENLMNLRSSKFLGTTNMCLFDHEGKIQRYSSPEDILQEFYLLRLAHYIRRRKYILERLSKELNELKNKVKFITAFVEGEIDIINKEDDMVKAEL